MRIAKVFLLTFVALTVIGASSASAQTPYIGVFSERAGWDPPPPGPPIIGDGLSHTFIPPGPPGALDSLYIVGYNLFCAQSVIGVEFQVMYPPEITPIADLDLQPSFFGSTATGLVMGWGFPGAIGFPTALNIATVLFQWNITSCGAPVPIDIKGHPLFASPNFPRYVCLENQLLLHQAVGVRGVICPAVPVEESTWGKVKALYRQ
jgi:hypothetical protein